MLKKVPSDIRKGVKKFFLRYSNHKGYEENEAVPLKELEDTCSDDASRDHSINK